MIKSQLRAFDLTARFFHTFRNVKYKNISVVRAMAYPFHMKAVKNYRGSKRLSLIRSPRHMYSKLIAGDRATAVTYHPAGSAKKIFTPFALEGLSVNRNQSIICLDKKNRRKQRAPYYNPAASGRFQKGQYNSLVRQIKAIVRRRGVHRYFKSRSFMSWIKSQLRTVMRQIDGIERLFLKNNIKAVVQASSVNPMGYLLVHMAKQRRVPTINLQYGLIDTYQIFSTNADYYVAWGAQHQKRLTRYGAPRNLFRLLGNARFDSIFSGKWMNKARLLRKVGIRRDKMVFVYPEQPLKSRYNRVAMKRVVQALQPYRRKIVLLVKKHPRQGGSGLTKSMMRKYPFAKVVRRSIRLYDLLNGADAAFVQFSTTGLEAMLFRKPVIALSFFPNTNKHEYTYYASSRLVTSARSQGQLRKIVAKVMNGSSYRRAMLNKQERYLLGAYSGGEHARRNISSLIDSMG